MNRPAITVVIATYNRAHLLRRAIESIQAQTYQETIIAVYDNASSDDTQEVMAQIAQSDPRIRYYRHRENIGGARNFLFGLHRVETPLFFFLSDDDIVLPHFFATAVTWLERYPSARLAAGGTLELTGLGELVFAPQAYWPRDGYFSPPQGLDLMLRGFHPSWNTILFRSEILEEIGGFNPDLPNVSDFDFTLRIVCRHPYIVFREPSGVFVRHPSSGGEFADASVIGQFELMTAGLLAAEDISDASKELIRRELPIMLYKRILQIAVKALLRRQPERAREALASYHNRYPATLFSLALDSLARAGTIFPPLLSALLPADALRRRTFKNRIYSAARSNGVLLDIPSIASYLK